MHIGIDVLFGGSGGSLTNLVTLLQEWAVSGDMKRHRFTLFCSTATLERLRNAVSADMLAEINTVVFPRSSRHYAFRFIDEQIRLPRLIQRSGIDVLFCPGNIIPYATRVPVIATFQNAVPFCESNTIRKTGLVRWLQFALLGALMRLTARRASAVIFISEYFRDLFVRRFRFDASGSPVILRSIRELRPGADEALEKRLGVRRPFLLYVSHLNPYKNVVELIEGFAIASKDVPGRQLVIAGMANFPAYKQKIDATIERFGLTGGRVVLTGEMPHADGLKLMTTCEGFVFASTCEMCPTALIEALSLGAPTACSNVNVMPEIAGEATVLFDPDNPADIARAVTSLVSDTPLRASLRERALARGRQFPSAAEVAQRTLETIIMSAGGSTR